MKKLKAYFLRHMHCLNYAFRLKTGHREVTEGIAYVFMGKIEVWFTATKISCECGKTWYPKKGKSEPYKKPWVIEKIRNEGA